ncbi:hypothetical protein [Bacillus sp. JFL15]|uniref:hypothetical protein n=1 Tax=Bacillus sp. JFL15 TaxID=1679193 RepID=UPI00066FCB0F|nr:hypothetical protein [Bacillus sp. JFL15]
MKNTASIEIRYIEDLNDKEGHFFYKSTKEELSKDEEEFDLSMGDLLWGLQMEICTFEFSELSMIH